MLLCQFDYALSMYIIVVCYFKHWNEAESVMLVSAYSFQLIHLDSDQCHCRCENV